ncbi:hypothetical protein BGX28_010453 [Mortierella sp. GBA30]|nr:hypothetical protein BGX28_010453 [Mortierella sp. GBA30]
MDPKLDRSRACNSRIPETPFLRWVEQQALHDSYRLMHLTERGYTLGKISRIDMIFVDTTLAGRFVTSNIKDMTDIVESDHHMATLTLTLHGTQHLTRPQAQKYKKPKGFRFLLKEINKEQWEDFANAVGQALQKDDRITELGLKKPVEEGE